MNYTNSITMDLFTFTSTAENTLKKSSCTDKIQKPATALWNKCLKIIKDNVNESVFKTWFKQIEALKWERNRLTLMVPSQFFIEWIEEHYYDLLKNTVMKVLGENAGIVYQIVIDESSNDSLEERTIKVPGFKYNPKTNQNSLQFAEPKPEPPFETNLQARYSFENFVTGDSNQLASSAAIAVAQKPGGTKFNPLVIYGDTGLGKTHLAQAIGNFIAHHSPKLRILFTNSEKFYFDFINAIQNNKVREFVNFYRSIDVLIVDDIQFFAGKGKTQDNFFHTFNALHQAGKQLIFTSDRPPRDLKDVDNRLISRFQWGLTVDVQPPDLEMRMAILQKKSLDEGIEIPFEIIEYLAKNVNSNVRDMEGTLISLIAKITLDKKQLSIELASEVINGHNRRDISPLSIEDIKLKVSTYYKLDAQILESKSRKHEIALARQMAIYLSKQLTRNSLKNIGQAFGGRDHSTVLHSCKTMENYLDTDRTVKSAYETLLGQFNKSL